jgi:predicted transcriptional regulator
MGNIVQLVKDRRREIGLTQEEPAKKIGVSQNYIAKMETNLTEMGLKH